MHEPTQSAEAISKSLARVRRLADFHVRRREQSFWIEGVRNFVQAYDAALSFDIVLHSPVLLKSPLAQMLVRRLGAAGVRRVRVTPEQFRSVSTTERASGIGAIVRQQWTRLEE